MQNDHLSPAPLAPGAAAVAPQRWSAAQGGGGAADQPLFLHDSTATALGLKGGPIPSVLRAALGDEARAPHVRRLHSLLAQPPPWHVAGHISAAVRCALLGS